MPEVQKVEVVKQVPKVGNAKKQLLSPVWCSFEVQYEERFLQARLIAYLPGSSAKLCIEQCSTSLVYLAATQVEKLVTEGQTQVVEVPAEILQAVGNRRPN